MAVVNGDPAILVHESGELTVVLVPELRNGLVSAVRAVLSPDKLAFIRAQLALINRPSQT
jgi:hypothetical protein